VRLFGVNQVGNEVGNPSVSADNRSIPWLQYEADQQVWTLWNITFRDVVLLDGENRELSRLNLTTHSLSDPANYADLKRRLVAAAGR
jgi:hypothetical protein